MVPAVSTTLQNAQTANADGTSINLTGYQFLGVQVSGEFIGNVDFEASLDSVGWCPVGLIQANSTTLYSSVISANSYAANLYITDANHPASALGNFRARTTNMTAGSVTVQAVQSGPVELQ